MARPTNQPGKTAQPAMPTWRCDHCQGKGKRRRVFFVRHDKKDAYGAILAIVLAEQAKPAKDRKRLTREELAVSLGIHSSFVHHALMRLNQEGLINQRQNRPPHDSTRDLGNSVGDSAWCASTYSIRDAKA